MHGSSLQRRRLNKVRRQTREMPQGRCYQRAEDYRQHEATMIVQPSRSVRDSSAQSSCTKIFSAAFWIGGIDHDAPSKADLSERVLGRQSLVSLDICDDGD